MRVTRVHVDTRLTAGQRATLEGTAANHVMRVLRARVGDELILFDGRGSEFGARIEEFRKEAVIVSVGDERALDRESPLFLTLAQGVSRGERMDWVVQKATELGVSRIVPVMTERTVVRLDAKQADKRTQHWRAIAVAACEQSGRNRVPDVTGPREFYAFVQGDAGPSETNVRTAESRTGAADAGVAAGAPHAHAHGSDRAGHGEPRPAAANGAGSAAASGAARAVAGSSHAPMRLLLSPTGHMRLEDLERPMGGVVVLIGPEGGLSESEQEAALSAGYQPLRLGPRVLRTETAAIAALTIIQREFGDL